MSIRIRGASGNKNARGTATTTNGTPTAISFKGGALSMPNNTTWVFTVDVAAQRTDSGTESAGYRLQATLRRGANAASTAVVGSVTALATAEDTAAWDCTVTADTTNGGPKVTVTGEAAKTIKWAAQYRITSVSA